MTSLVLRSFMRIGWCRFAAASGLLNELTKLGLKRQRNFVEEVMRLLLLPDGP